jgi:hypothetical protein
MAWAEKRGGRYRVRYRLPDGSLFTEGGFTSRADAEKRAADVESDQRRELFVDPRLAHTTVGEWVQVWAQAHEVSPITRNTYDSHLRNHILPRFADMPLGEVQRMTVKAWVKTLRATLAEKSVSDVAGLLSMILGEAVDEGLLGANPCRKLALLPYPWASAGVPRSLRGRPSQVKGAFGVADAMAQAPPLTCEPPRPLRAALRTGHGLPSTTRGTPADAADQHSSAHRGVTAGRRWPERTLL